MRCARFPTIESPCPQLPDMPADAPRVWCERCAKPVHNLSAMTDSARAELLSRPGPLCVSYRLPRRPLAALAAGALLLATGALAQDSDTAEVPEVIEVVGGGIRVPAPPVASVFKEEVPEQADTEVPTPESP